MPAKSDAEKWIYYTQTHTQMQLHVKTEANRTAQLGDVNLPSK